MKIILLLICLLISSPAIASSEFKFEKSEKDGEGTLKLTEHDEGYISGVLEHTSIFNRELHRVTTGLFEGTGRINGKNLTLTNPEYPSCSVNVTFQGIKLLVKQNGYASDCGLGVDVDVSGVYTMKDNQSQDRNVSQKHSPAKENYVDDGSIEDRVVLDKNIILKGLVKHYKGVQNSGDTPYYYLLMKNKKAKIICFCGSKEYSLGCNKFNEFTKSFDSAVEISGANLSIISSEADYECIDVYTINQVK